MSTCYRLDLQTLGSQPVLPKNLPDHWWRGHSHFFPRSFWSSNECIIHNLFIERSCCPGKMRGHNRCFQVQLDRSHSHRKKRWAQRCLFLSTTTDVRKSTERLCMVIGYLSEKVDHISPTCLLHTLSGGWFRV